MSRKLKNSDMFELMKDIVTPTSYTRAGKRLTKKEWETEIPTLNLNEFIYSDWFLKVEDKEEVERPDRIFRIVDEEFTKSGLLSLSYMAVARRCIEKYIEEMKKLTTGKEPFSFIATAKKQKDGNVCAWTDGISIESDTEQHCAYRLVKGERYKVTIEKVEKEKKA